MKLLLENWRKYLNEEIFGAQAILYHASREEPDKFLPYITGPAGNFKSSGAGSIYGPGLYTVFDEKGVDFIGKAYGNFIYKFKVNLRGFIILDEAITQKVYKKSLLPSEQAQELGLSSKAVLALKELENEKPINNMAVAKLVQNEAKGLLISKGDIPQAVLYKPGVAVPMAWKKYKETSWIPWKKGESSWNEIPPSIREPNIKRSALDINERKREYISEVGMGFDMAKSIEYTAFVLDESSHQKLSQLAPNGWKVYAHHMTMIPPTKQKQRLPSEQFYEGCLTVTGIAQDERVVAARVDTTSQNLYTKVEGPPHITIATNPETGGKPAMSNEFGEQDFKSIDPVEVCGKVEEVMK